MSTLLREARIPCVAPSQAQRTGGAWLFCETNVHPPISDADYRRFLRYPPHRPLTEPMQAVAAWARGWFRAHARPWCCALAVEARVVGNRLLLGTSPFGTESVARKLAGVQSGAIVIASAGGEGEAEAAERWSAGEPDSYFFLESYAAAMAEALVRQAELRLAPRVDGHGLFPRCGPGYAGWPIDELPRLLGLATRAGAFPGNLRALSSGALQPKKSHVIFVGIGAQCA